MPIPHLGEMRRLFEDIPLTEMNTSMTINATAMWLLALYQVVAEEQNPDLEPLEVAHQLAGTTQNDIIKEYLSRGTYVFPPEHSLRLISDVISYTVNEIRSGTRSTSAAITCRRPGRPRRRSSPMPCARPSPSSTRSRPPGRSPRRTSRRSSGWAGTGA